MVGRIRVRRRPRSGGSGDGTAVDDGFSGDFSGEPSGDPSGEYFGGPSNDEMEFDDLDAAEDGTWDGGPFDVVESDRQVADDDDEARDRSVIVFRNGGASRRRTLLVTVAAVVIAASIVAVVLATPVLHVRRVEVVGATHTGEPEVLRMAGSVDDVTLLEINSRSIRSSVRRLPWVDDVDVVRAFPWTLRLEVSERVPAAMVEFEGTRALLDGEGRVLEVLAPEATVAGVAKVIGTSKLPPPGSVWADPNGTRALASMQGLPVALVSLLDRVEIGAAGELAMTTREGTVIRFGLPVAVATKGGVALHLVRDLQRRNVKAETIDVSSPLAPAYKAVPPQKPKPPSRRRGGD